MPGRTTAQGYGWRHQQERERWRRQVEAGLVDCWRCVEAGRPDPRIYSGQDWDLGHDDADPAKRRYRGPEHRRCNRAAGGRKGLAMRGLTRWSSRPRRRMAELTVDLNDL